MSKKNSDKKVEVEKHDVISVKVSRGRERESVQVEVKGRGWLWKWRQNLYPDSEGKSTESDLRAIKEIQDSILFKNI